MKQIILSMSLVFTFSLNAQLVTITEANQIPQIGDTISYIDANTFGFVADGTGPVTSTLWDFSTLMSGGSEIDYWYIDASTTAQSSSFPNANLARQSSTATGEEYYETTGTQINRWGMYANPTTYMIQNDPAILFQFPITAGGSYSCSYDGDFSPFGAGEDSVKVEQGQVLVSADRQGTLILPNGTYNDVLRLHLVESFHIKAYMIGIAVIDVIVEDDYYYWFVEDRLQPILIYGTTNQDGSQVEEVLRYQKSCDYFFSENYSICSGDSYLWHGTNYTTAGIYYDNDTTIIGCDSIYELTLTVNPNPTINLGADTTICDYESIVLDAGNGFSAYNWSTSASTQTISIDSTGIGIGTANLYVTVTDVNGCINADTIAVTFDDCTNIDNIPYQKVNLYPNPSNGVINVDGVFYSIQVFDLIGKKLFETNNNIIDLGDFKKGIYLIKISTNRGEIKKKLILK